MREPTWPTARAFIQIWKAPDRRYRVKRMVLLLTVAAALVLALALPASAVDEGADVAHSTCFHSDLESPRQEVPSEANGFIVDGSGCSGACIGVTGECR